MKFKRASGILLHPTSLPGPYGIGDLGENAHKWIEFLSSSDCGLWQVLPLGPTGYGDSPYQCFSSFAGNPYLISPEELFQEGLLTEDELNDHPDWSPAQVDYGSLINWKVAILDTAYERFIAVRPSHLRQELAKFQADNADWLNDFSLFMAIKESQGGAPWSQWPAPLRDRDPEMLSRARQEYSHAVERQLFHQFFFFRQWNQIREHAKKLNIQIIGDIPIFVAHDSADVWSHPELFYLDDQGLPSVVAGVPPDYYSETGQLWGNPLYRWDIHKASGFTWWLSRIQAVLKMVDIVRLDHFRGFAGYWEVPGDAKTAVKGRWMPGPGKEFFQRIKETLGDLPFIAEDLGEITPDVVELRETFSLPGMKVMLFAFLTDPSDPFMPHHYTEQCVVYTGTHDNDTVRGWYERVSEEEKDFYRRYLARDGSNVAWDFIRASWSSVAAFALAPLQDFLDLGNEARMNYPGNPRGNWTWRMPSEAMNVSLANRIKEYNYLFYRNNKGDDHHKD